MIIMKKQIDLHPLIDGRHSLGDDMVPHLYLVIRGRMPMSSLESSNRYGTKIDGWWFDHASYGHRDLYMIFVPRPIQR